MDEVRIPKQACTTVGSRRIQEKTWKTKDKLERHIVNKDLQRMNVINLGRGWSISSRQTDLVSTCGHTHRRCWINQVESIILSCYAVTYTLAVHQVRLVATILTPNYLPTHLTLILYRVFFWFLTFLVYIVSVYLFISTVYLVVLLHISLSFLFPNCYIHIFSSSAASVSNKFSSVQFSPCFSGPRKIYAPTRFFM